MIAAFEKLGYISELAASAACAPASTAMETQAKKRKIFEPWFIVRLRLSNSISQISPQRIGRFPETSDPRRTQGSSGTVPGGYQMNGMSALVRATYDGYWFGNS